MRLKGLLKPALFASVFAAVNILFTGLARTVTYLLTPSNTAVLFMAFAFMCGLSVVFIRITRKLSPQNAERILNGGGIIFVVLGILFIGVFLFVLLSGITGVMSGLGTALAGAADLYLLLGAFSFLSLIGLAAVIIAAAGVMLGYTIILFIVMRLCARYERLVLITGVVSFAAWVLYVLYDINARAMIDN